MLLCNASKHRRTISTAQNVTKRIGDLASIGDYDNVWRHRKQCLIRPGYVIVTSLKPSYLGTTHESTF